MPQQHLTQAVAQAYHQITDSLPGFRERAGQKRMIWEVTKVFAGDGEANLLAVEAPTGTGKSMAYLMPGVLAARERGLHLVVATATVGLQEQVLEQDLPKLAHHADLEIMPVLAKGRRRYICPRDLEEAVASTPTGSDGGQGGLPEPEADPGAGAWMAPPEAGDIEALQAMAEKFWNGGWLGDLDTWPDPVSYALWEAITAPGSSCPGQNCSYESACPVRGAQKAAKKASLVIANHNLVLADLELGGGILLPPPEETIYVFDEGHHLGAKAGDQLAATAMVEGAQEWIKNGHGVVNRLAEIASEDELNTTHENLNELLDRLKEVRTFLDHNLPDQADEQGVWRFQAGRPPETVQELASRVAAPARKVKDNLVRNQARIEKEIREEEGGPELEKILPKLGFLIDRLDNLHLVWSRMAEAEDGTRPPNARWFEGIKRSRQQKQTIDYRAAASPITVGEELKAMLWDQCAGAVITSATLTALGRFDRLKANLGLPSGPDEGLVTARLNSPFDLSRSVLAVPAMDTDPKAGEEHTQEVIRQLPELINPGEATLVLFTSRSRMERVAKTMPEEMKRILQCQGERSREDMLTRHRRAVDAGGGSLLFGLAGMAEGVDLPGAYCRHVVIERIPFSVPTEPVEATLAEWLEQQGRKPFFEVSLPDASLRLIQACGRLVRTEEDHGRITILDRRIATKGYGKDLLAGLPPFTHEVA